ncbi:DNA alkylation repair protein [marine bacterium AO1-C]|nr:DNA alkylation repair protein [marine bacterium AO1-C]
MTTEEIMASLEEMGNDQTKKTLMNHGAQEPMFGVKVQDLKKVLKKTKKNHELSLELYATGNSDAMYLAGLMADEKQITKEQLQDWVEKAYWYFLYEYTVPWIAADTEFGFELGLEWIKSDKENIAAAGWSTLAGYAGVNPDEKLDTDIYTQLLDQVGEEIHDAQNRVRYTMNGFVIAIGTYIPALTDKAQEVAAKIGKVKVNMGGTACKVPLATEYITKVIDKGRVGKKRKTARC